MRASLAQRFGPDLREKHHKKATRNLIDAGRIRQLGSATLDDHNVLSIAAAEGELTPPR